MMGPVSQDSSENGIVVTVPASVSTQCPELDLVWARYANLVVDRPGIGIPDTDDDLTWHAFLGHSIDMQGFRSPEFAGVDAMTRPAPQFVSLRERRVGVPELASLWAVPAIREHLLHGTRCVPLSRTLDVLRADGGPLGASLAAAFEFFSYRKFHWAVRALLQNSATLTDSGFSFREWLHRECVQIGVEDFPPPDFRRSVAMGHSRLPLEVALRSRLEATFYEVGPALAAYMLCDWQLWLWSRGLTGVFATFKWDSFQDQFISRYNHGIVPSDEAGFVRWWLDLYPDLPPRLANECIWLGTEHKIV
jgi:hypothetical protein